MTGFLSAFILNSAVFPFVLFTAGTSVVANDDGRPSLTRLGAIVEQVAEVRFFY